jgi:tRNA G18 (ribose-2'-O)-methylase SpoU
VTIEPVRVAALDDPRLDDYRDLKEARLRAAGDAFVAESELVVRKLLASGLGVRSVLVTEPRWRALVADAPLRPDVPVYLVEQAIMDGVAGFHVHRGCLAVGVRPRGARVPDDARTVVVLEDLVDVDNLGAIVRNAAAFGADAILLSPRCADPFYRKAIRVSMGNVFAMPIVRAVRWPDDLLALRERYGLALVGAVLDPAATPLRRFVRPERIALLLGSEGPGLTAVARAACDALVTIPMANADSLNVATAGAVLLHHLTTE